jgi:uncharacterized protein (TIGR04255 family)
MFHFPPEITLKRQPLVEAWLEIRWQLKPDSSLPDAKVDPGFAFALGVFYERVKDIYGYPESLLPPIAPDEILPHVVRYRFRKQENTWPVLQLGPGIATLNFTSPYSWADFRTQALYLRTQLKRAYAEHALTIQDLTLRFRNAVEFDYIANNLLVFLKTELNTLVAPPQFIPGDVAARMWPHELNLVQTYELLEPKGEGKLRIATGQQHVRNEQENNLSRRPVVVFELEVRSDVVADRCWTSDEDFGQWLDSAHTVIHEWFFALIEGKLRREYEGG